MKTKLLLFALFFSATIFAQTTHKTITYIGKGVNGIETSYLDEQGGKDYILYPFNLLTHNDSVTMNSWVATIQAKLDTMQYVYEPLKSITVTSYSSTNGVLSLTGTKGFTRAIDTKNLTGNNATIKTNFYSFVHSATGQNLSTLIANYDGNDEIIINGVPMNTDHADSISGGLISQAKQMCLQLLNGATP